MIVTVVVASISEEGEVAVVPDRKDPHYAPVLFVERLVQREGVQVWEAAAEHLYHCFHTMVYRNVALHS